jgi:hypothetical protein
MNMTPRASLIKINPQQLMVLKRLDCFMATSLFANHVIDRSGFKSGILTFKWENEQKKFSFPLLGCSLLLKGFDHSPIPGKCLKDKVSFNLFF